MTAGDEAGRARSLRLRGLRGATTASEDTPAAIAEATRELLVALLDENALQLEDVVSAIFTSTADLTSTVPARAARELGWVDVPMLCTMEAPSAANLPRCIRVLLHVETSRARDELRHVYLRDARALRPDLGDDSANGARCTADEETPGTRRSARGDGSGSPCRSPSERDAEDASSHQAECRAPNVGRTPFPERRPPIAAATPANPAAGASHAPRARAPRRTS